MKNLWKDLVSKFSNDLDLIENFYGIIEKKYCSFNRHYHNLDHISLMLSEVRRFKNRINDYDSVCLAIWFHDIMYNPKRRDNEEKSANYAGTFLTEIKYDPQKIIEVKKMIVKTKEHQPDEINDNYDTKLLLDLDLLILGTNPEVYHIYAQNVRKEYLFVPEQIYAEERAMILKNFLKRGKIFKTKEFQDAHEVNARRNIQAEIDDILK